MADGSGRGRMDSVADVVAADASQEEMLCVSLVQEDYTVEEGLTFIGHGLMQRLLLIILGAACATYSANVVLMSFLEPNVCSLLHWKLKPLERSCVLAYQVKCEWELNGTQETMISVVVFLGMVFGSNLWGALADHYGRKLGTGLSLVVEGAAGVVTSVAPNYWSLLLSRGIVGIGIGGLATSFATYSEFLPTDVRGYSLCWYQMFWAGGAVLEAAIAWIIVPEHGWRALALATALPPLALLPVIALLPESPRYLIVAGRPDLAMQVIQKIAAVNGRPIPRGTIRSPFVAESSTAASSKRSFLEQLASLFTHPLNRVTPVVWFLAFALGVGYYATIILTATVHTPEDKAECIGKESNVDSSDYLSILIDASAELPGVILALFTIERLGRLVTHVNRSMLWSWCACWIAMLSMLLFPAEKTSFLFVARLFTAYTDIFIFVLTPEIYPSSCRCFAMGAMSSASQIGGMASPFVARALFRAYGLRVVSGLCATVFLTADIMTCLLLPFETAGKAMKDDVNDYCLDPGSEAQQQQAELLDCYQFP